MAPAFCRELSEVSRGSFAAGLTIVLIIAGGIGTLGALLIGVLVSTAEIAPAQRPHAAASRLPGVMD